MKWYFQSSRFLPSNVLAPAGKIYAIQLDYQRSYASLMQALRKAPQHTGLGFRITVCKFSRDAGVCERQPRFCLSRLLLFPSHTLVLDVSTALTHLSPALQAQQIAIIVQLLMGEVPERTTFEQPEMQLALRPYLHLAQAVRRGSLADYEEEVTNNASVFQRDGTHSLVLRCVANDMHPAC